MKKAISILLVLVMAIGICIPAYAGENELDDISETGNILKVELPEEFEPVAALDYSGRVAHYNVPEYISITYENGNIQIYNEQDSSFEINGKKCSFSIYLEDPAEPTLEIRIGDFWYSFNAKPTSLSFNENVKRLVGNINRRLLLNSLRLPSFNNFVYDLKIIYEEIKIFIEYYSFSCSV